MSVSAGRRYFTSRTQSTGNARDAQEVGEHWGYHKSWENELKMCISSELLYFGKVMGLLEKQAVKRCFKLKPHEGEEPQHRLVLREAPARCSTAHHSLPCCGKCVYLVVASAVFTHYVVTTVSTVETQVALANLTKLGHLCIPSLVCVD